MIEKWLEIAEHAATLILKKEVSNAINKVNAKIPYSSTVFTNYTKNKELEYNVRISNIENLSISIKEKDINEIISELMSILADDYQLLHVTTEVHHYASKAVTRYDEFTIHVYIPVSDILDKLKENV